MKRVKIKCAFCNKVFFRPKGQFKEAKKFRWKQFCSPKCLAFSKMNGCELSCANHKCTNKFYRARGEQKKVKRSFCSCSCAAQVHNRERIRRCPLKLCSYKFCDKQIPSSQKYCSRIHSSMAKKFSVKEWKANIIQRIQSFYKKNQRIPVKREFAGIYRDTLRVFGSWNNAIKAAGFKPNPILFSNKQIAKDGHICDSIAEKIIDDWLYDNKIAHDRNVHYPNNKYTADFKVNGKFIEFFGLAGEILAYDKIIAEKQKLAKKYNLPLIKIYPKDLYAKGKLDSILNSTFMTAK